MAKKNTSVPSTFELAQLAIQLRSQFPDLCKDKPPTGTEKVLARRAAEKAAEEGKPAPKLRHDIFREAVRLALELWDTASTACEDRAKAREQLRELYNGIFTLKPDEWTARIKDYKGPLEDIDKMLDEELYSVSQVAARLYRNRSYSALDRKAHFLGLIKYAADRKLVFTDGYKFWREDEPAEAAQASIKSLQRSYGQRKIITARQCRYFVEARQKQLSASRSRWIPEYRKYEKQD